METITDEELQTRSAAFVNWVDELHSLPGFGSTSTDDEVLRTIPHGDTDTGTIILERRHMLNRDERIEDLSLETLVRLGKYLIKTAIWPSTWIPAPREQFEYISWVAAVGAAVPPDAILDDSNGLLLSFLHSVHVALLQNRGPGENANRSVESVFMDSSRLAYISSIAALEGMISNCGTILDSDNRLTETVEIDWRESHDPRWGAPRRVSHHGDVLQIWRKEATGQIESVLTDINDLTRYEEATIKKKFGSRPDDVDREYRSPQNHNLFGLLGGHRNGILHGQTRTAVASQIELILGCLYILDRIDKANIPTRIASSGYERGRNMVVNLSRTQGRPIMSMTQPNSFYPL